MDRTRPSRARKFLHRAAGGEGLSFFLVDFHDAHDVDVGVLERLLDVGELGILHFQDEIRSGSHGTASWGKRIHYAINRTHKLSQTRRSSQQRNPGQAVTYESRTAKPDIKALFTSGYPADVMHSREFTDQVFSFSRAARASGRDRTFSASCLTEKSIP
jgi:hypothetical protein